ncbi:hypothetical protein SHKM778_28210 [Streptomyces sp. KM77-8]|uniref:Cationic amino acid transporter C-terminal domain-containing protein n=1 Tax=Streptomyces haneummycinicus TaxID=3074435 RepID=A0AAT9HGN0_9ACTN
MIILRRTRPDLPRAFRTPWVPALPVVSVAASLWLMVNLPTETWIRFGVWMAIGVVVYFLYSRTHSRLARGEAEPGTPLGSSGGPGSAEPAVQALARARTTLCPPKPKE